MSCIKQQTHIKQIYDWRVIMSNEEMDELQKEAERLEDEFTAMGKMFEETGYFTQEDKELVEYLNREYRTRH